MTDLSNTYDWYPPFKKWYEVDIEVYKFIFEQAEKRHDDVLSESEAITSKSVKVTTGIVALFSFFVGILIEKNISIDIFSIGLTVSFLYNIIDAIGLMFPKEVISRGFSPSELISEDINDEENKGFEAALLYHSAIQQLDNVIKRMRANNRIRAKKYKRILKVGIAILITSTLYFIAVLVFTHPLQGCLQ